MMKLTEKWLNDPTDFLKKYTGVRVWNTDAATDKDGVLTFGQSPATVTKHAARLILAENTAGFGISLVSDRPFTGLQTHYERPALQVEFNIVSISDEYPDMATLYGKQHDGIVAELPVESADIIAWTFCTIINQKTSQKV